MGNLNKKITFYALHVSMCLAFLLLPYVFTANGAFLRLPDLYNNGHDRTYFGIYFALLVFFYVNYYFLIPRFYFSNRKILYFVIIFLFLVFFLTTTYIFDRPDFEIIGHPRGLRPQFRPHDLPFSHGPHFGPFDLKPNQNSHTILIFITGVLTSLFLSINRRLRNSESDKMQAELSMLKAQINPHFLFNTLNSIYALAIRKDEKTADAVVQLAELMRYIMNNANDNTIDLDKEINYISNYISLQRARLGETVRIDYHVNGKAIGEKITPLILISFIENAFKHGVNPDENSEIEVRISIDGHQLQLMVRNNKVRSVHNEGGIGMKNTRARLQMLYAGRHSLETRENEQYYVVELKMDL